MTHDDLDPMPEDAEEDVARYRRNANVAAMIGNFDLQDFYTAKADHIERVYAPDAPQPDPKELTE